MRPTCSLLNTKHVFSFGTTIQATARARICLLLGVLALGITGCDTELAPETPYRKINPHTFQAFWGFPEERIEFFEAIEGFRDAEYIGVAEANLTEWGILLETTPNERAEQGPLHVDVFTVIDSGDLQAEVVVRIKQNPTGTLSVQLEVLSGNGHPHVHALNAVGFVVNQTPEEAFSYVGFVQYPEDASFTLFAEGSHENGVDSMAFVDGFTGLPVLRVVHIDALVPGATVYRYE